MDFDKYKMTRPYPPAPDYPWLPTNPTPEDCRKYADAKEAHLQAIEVWKKERSDWEAEESRLLALFKADVLAEVGLTNHPKADKAYDLAYLYGYSSGLAAVYNHLMRYAELLKD